MPRKRKTYTVRRLKTVTYVAYDEVEAYSKKEVLEADENLMSHLLWIRRDGSDQKLYEDELERRDRLEWVSTEVTAKADRSAITRGDELTPEAYKLHHSREYRRLGIGVLEKYRKVERRDISEQESKFLTKRETSET